MISRFWLWSRTEVLQPLWKEQRADWIGVLQTAINAVTLALVDAGIPMNDYICATSAGLVDNNAILGPQLGFL